MNKMSMKKFNTIHSSRTMMFAELSRVIDHAGESGDFREALTQNVTGKKSGSGILNTAKYLRKLYGFDLQNPIFKAFHYFWTLAEPDEKHLIAFVYAVHHDDLLAESIEVLHKVKFGEKATIELFEEVIEKYHPNQYSTNTRRSMAQNLASSWKQAGYIEGKVKNVRVQPVVSHRVACYAFLQAFLNGDRGDFIWNSKGIQALCLSDSNLRELAIECARKDLIQYQYAGNVTVIGFTSLLNKIGIDGYTN